MAQISHLDSAKEKTGKFSVSVERVVYLGNYESLRVGLAEVLDLASEKPEGAYPRILQKVDGWTAQFEPVRPPVRGKTPERFTCSRCGADLGSIWDAELTNRIDAHVKVCTRT